MSPGLTLAILILQGIEHQKPFVGTPVCIGQHVGLLLQVEDSSEDLSSITDGQIWKLGNDFSFAHAVWR
jgi:hypothetical protein